MVWGYLTEFWNSITQVGTYTIEWFQNIGNAVAGAIGNLFEFINHSLSDIFVYGGWFFSSLGVLFQKFWLPINYIFNFIKAFVGKAIATPTDQNIWAFSEEVKAIFQQIPYWSTLSMVLGICILIIFGIAILKQFLRS